MIFGRRRVARAHARLQAHVANQIAKATPWDYSKIDVTTWRGLCALRSSALLSATPEQMAASHTTLGEYGQKVSQWLWDNASHQSGAEGQRELNGAGRLLHDFVTKDLGLSTNPIIKSAKQLRIEAETKHIEWLLSRRTIKSAIDTDTIMAELARTDSEDRHYERELHTWLTRLRGSSPERLATAFEEFSVPFEFRQDLEYLVRATAMDYFYSAMEEAGDLIRRRRQEWRRQEIVRGMTCKVPVVRHEPANASATPPQSEPPAVAVPREDIDDSLRQGRFPERALMAVDYLTFKEALDALQTTEAALKDLVAKAELRAFRAGSSLKFKREDVESFKQTSLARTASTPATDAAEEAEDLGCDDSTSDTIIRVRDIVGGSDAINFDAAPPGLRTRDISVVPRAPAAASDRHAVIVGVSKFASAGITELPSAERDASDLHGVLTDPARAGVDAGNVKLLLGADATLDAVKQALGVFLERSAAENDLVLLYFATHGLVQGREGYLLLHDSDPASPFRTALRMGELASILDSLSTGNVVLILDACHAGATTPSEAWYRVLDGFGASAGSRVVLASCGAAEQSLEVDTDRNGLFTKHLLAGLRGDADHRRQGAVGIEDLFSYVRDHVRDDAARLGRTQTPSWWGKVQTPMLLTHDPVGQHPKPGVIHRRGAPRLLVLDDVGPRVRLRLTGKCTTIGRHPDCDVQLMGDRRVSRDHAKIERRDGGWVLTSQAPAERTYRNGAAVPPGQPQRLADGDELRLGSTRLLFLWDGAATPSETGRVEPAEGAIDEPDLDLELDFSKTRGAEVRIAPDHREVDSFSNNEMDYGESIFESQPVGPPSNPGVHPAETNVEAEPVAYLQPLRTSNSEEPFRPGDKSNCSLFILDFAALSPERQERARALAAEVRRTSAEGPPAGSQFACLSQRMKLLPVLEFCSEQELLHARALFDRFEIPTRVAYGLEDLTPGEIEHLYGPGRLERRTAPPADEGALVLGSTKSLPNGNDAVDHIEAIWSSDQDMPTQAGARLATPCIDGPSARAISDSPDGPQQARTSDRYALEIYGLQWPERRERALAVLAELRGTKQEGALNRDRMVVIEDGTKEEIERARLQFEAAKVSTRVTRVTRKEPSTTKAVAVKGTPQKGEGLWCLHVANLSSPELRAAGARILAEASGCSREEADRHCQTPMVLTNCDESLVRKVKERFDARGFSTRVIRVTETSS
jgi:hypothetical protein